MIPMIGRGLAAAALRAYALARVQFLNEAASARFFSEGGAVFVKEQN